MIELIPRTVVGFLVLFTTCLKTFPLEHKSKYWLSGFSDSSGKIHLPGLMFPSSTYVFWFSGAMLSPLQLTFQVRLGLSCHSLKNQIILFRDTEENREMRRGSWMEVMGFHCLTLGWYEWDEMWKKLSLSTWQGSLINHCKRTAAVKGGWLIPVG